MGISFQIFTCPLNTWPQTPMHGNQESSKIDYFARHIDGARLFPAKTREDATKKH